MHRAGRPCMSAAVAVHPAAERPPLMSAARRREGDGVGVRVETAALVFKSRLAFSIGIHVTFLALSSPRNES